MMRKNNPLPDREYLLQIFEDAGTTVKWRVAKGSKVYVGMPVTCLTDKGYLRVMVDGQTYLVHRVLFKMRTGREPEAIDHIDGDKQNNSDTNLREATRSMNGFNRPAQSNSSSGFKNVTKCKETGKWHAKVSVKRRAFYGPRTDDILQAAEDAKRLRQLHHGDFAHD